MFCLLVEWLGNVCLPKTDLSKRSTSRKYFRKGGRILPLLCHFSTTTCWVETRIIILCSATPTLPLSSGGVQKIVLQ